MSRSAPLIGAESGKYLVMVINRAAASFDVAALSREEVVELCMLMDRITKELMDHHKHVILPLYLSLAERLGPLQDAEDSEPDDSGGSSH